MRHLFKYLFSISLFFFLVLIPVKAVTFPVNAYLFYGSTCPHCSAERVFINSELKENYPNLNVFEFEIYNDFDNIEILQKVAEKLNAGVNGVPFLVIGDTYFIGYANGMTSSAISKRVLECSKELCPDSVAEIVNVKTISYQENAIREGFVEVDSVEQNTPTQSGVEELDKPFEDNVGLDFLGEAESGVDQRIKLPIFGEVNIIKFSLPILAVIIGSLDGFNPCALWTLLFLISLLLGMEDKRRMWTLGIIFIVASASVYFLFMSAWLNFILFLGFVFWVRLLVGLFALAGGSYSVRAFFVDKDSGCKVTNSENRQKVFKKLKAVALQKNFILAIFGIIVLAFVVNLVELVCSAGLPAIYTQVLALNNLSSWQYYFLILLYIFFFMLDDIFVFLLAMITLEMTGVTTKYARYSRLAGGLILFTVGLLLIFKPGWLMFN